MAASKKPSPFDLPGGQMLFGNVSYGKTMMAAKMIEEMSANSTGNGADGKGFIKSIYLHADIEGEPPAVPASSRYFTRKGLLSAGGWLTRDQRFLLRRGPNGRGWTLAPSIWSKSQIDDRKVLASNGLIDTVFSTRRVAYTQLQLALNSS